MWPSFGSRVALSLGQAALQEPSRGRRRREPHLNPAGHLVGAWIRGDVEAELSAYDNLRRQHLSSLIRRVFNALSMEEDGQLEMRVLAARVGVLDLWALMKSPETANLAAQTCQENNQTSSCQVRLLTGT